MVKLKILIVEDEYIWTTLLSTNINKEEDMEVVAVARGREEAIKILNDKKIDIVLIDINLTEKNLDGLYLTVEISEVFNAKIIVITELNPSSIATEAFNAGAHYFVSKNNYRNIPNIIRMCSNNNNPIEELLKDYRRLRKMEIINELTGAEREILKLLIMGHNRSEIQAILIKSESTVKNQINKMLSKLNVKNTREAITYINKRGLLPDRLNIKNEIV